MNYKKYIYILFTGTIALSSCKKDFLVETPPTAVPIGQAIKTESDLADAVNGMYSAMRSSNLFGRDVPVLGDVLADNAYVYSTNSGRYLQQQAYTYINSNAEASNIWTQGYYAILQANRVIYAANTQFATATTNVNQLKGEAYIARALNYLTLVNFFAQPATVNSGAAGVPLVTSPINAGSTSALVIKPSRATVAAVYDKIISDLDSAYNIMPASYSTLHAASSAYLSKYAAKAIQARAYLYQGNYAAARDAAQVVVSSGNYTQVAPANLVAYWSNPAPVSTKVETIFELALNTATNNGTNGLDYIYAQAGYGDLLAYSDLYNSYEATDARKNLFLTTSSTKGSGVFVVNKYTNVTNATDKDDIKIIRYSEVLLTLAEAYARTGDQANALVYLNQFVKNRDASKVYNSTGTALISDIINERRKELAFEGLRYFDLQRLNVDVVRPNQASTATTVRTLPAGNAKRILPIPQSETDANSNIVQNPGY